MDPKELTVATSSNLGQRLLAAGRQGSTLIDSSLPTGGVESVLQNQISSAERRVAGMETTFGPRMELFSSEVLILFSEPCFNLTHSHNVMLLRRCGVILINPARRAC
jgi:hypothetical protein